MKMGRYNETYHNSYSFQEVAEPYYNDDAYSSYENDVFLSKTRQIVAAIIPMCTGLISAIGSISLMYLILTEDIRSKRMRQHLLLFRQQQQQQRSRNNSTDDNHRDREGTKSGGEPNDSVWVGKNSDIYANGSSDDEISFRGTTSATRICANDRHAQLLPATMTRASTITTTTTLGTITNQETTSPYQRKSTLKQHYKNNDAVRVNRTFQRIMIGLCLSDLCAILGAASSTFPLPAGTTGVWLAKGTTTTCAMQGFFVQLGLSSVLYSASLSIYFLLSILPNIRSGTIEKIEPYLHAVPIIFAISTGTAGLFLQIFNPVPLGLSCWIAAYPRGCSSSSIDTSNNGDRPVPCTRGEKADLLLWVFGGSAVFSSYIIIILCMTWMYMSIRNQLHKIEFRYGFSRTDTTNTNNVTTQITSTTDATANTTISSRSFIDVFIKSQETPGSSTSTIKRNETSATTTDDVAAAAAASTISNNAASELSTRSKKRLQNVSTQAKLYVMVFFLAYVWATIHRIMEFRNKTDGKFVINILHLTFFPSQGFFNLMIYLRPRYTEIRLYNTAISRIHAIKIVLGFGTSRRPRTIRPKRRWSFGLVGAKRRRHSNVGEEHLDDTGTPTRRNNSCETGNSCGFGAIAQHDDGRNNSFSTRRIDSCGCSNDASARQRSRFRCSNGSGFATRTARRGSGDAMSYGRRRRSRGSSDSSSRLDTNCVAERTITTRSSSRCSSGFHSVTTTPTIISPPAQPIEKNSTNATVMTRTNTDMVVVASKKQSPISCGIISIKSNGNIDGDHDVDNNRQLPTIIGFASVPCSSSCGNISCCHSAELEHKGSKSLVVHRNSNLDDDNDLEDLESNYGDGDSSTSHCKNRSNSTMDNFDLEKCVAHHRVRLEHENKQIVEHASKNYEERDQQQQLNNEVVAREKSNLFTSCWASEDEGYDDLSEAIIELDGTDDNVE